jgi:pimeloyl-ACP methyl ester carboxylesterase
MATEATVRSTQACDGVELRYEVLGEGEPVMFLHGGMAGRDAFDRQRPLADHFRLVLRDLRGHNRCAWGDPPDYGLETTEHDDLLRVLDAEEIERAHLVGHSSGGAIAFAFARRCPDRVRRIVLIEPTLLALAAVSSQPDADSLTRRLRELIGVAGRQGNRPALRGLLDTMAGAGWEERTRPATLAQLHAAAPIVVPHLQALLDLQVSPEDVQELAPRVLYLFGAETVWTYRAIAGVIAGLVPPEHCQVFEDAGHGVHRQRAAEVNDLIRRFLGGSDA